MRLQPKSIGGRGFGLHLRFVVWAKRSFLSDSPRPVVLNVSVPDRKGPSPSLLQEFLSTRILCRVTEEPYYGACKRKVYTGRRVEAPRQPKGT